MKQMWKCDRCGNERQWGSVSMAYTKGAVQEANDAAIARAAARKVETPALQVVAERPILACEVCGKATRHFFSRDQQDFESQNEPQRAVSISVGA
jgi:hypothetical protein